MSWDDMLGQEVAKRALQARLAHTGASAACLLAGPEGVGKRLLALETAKALLCAASGPRPCGACRPCGQAARGVHPDLHLLAPGGASGQIRIEEIRTLLGRLALRPFCAPVQVALIDGVERLTEEAANSLLKSLEEPGSTTRFLLTTSQLNQCLPTIVSRCQVLRCQALAPEVIARILVSARRAEPGAAALAGRLARGSASRAIELYERWSAREQLLARVASQDPAAWFSGPMPEGRREIAELLDGLVTWLRDVAVAATADAGSVLHLEQAKVLQRQAAAVDVDRCLQTAFELVTLRDSLEQFANTQLVASLAREKWLSLVETKTT